MASISYDSELMTNYVEATNVPTGSHMVLCRDPATSQPVVVALSNHDVPKLQLIKVTAGGRRTRLDLGHLAGVPANSIIQTFDIQQATDGLLRLAFAVKQNDRESLLWIVRPFRLSDTMTLTPLPQRTVGKVSRIRMGAGVDDSDEEAYPNLYITHQPLQRTASGSDLTRVEVSVSKGSWRTWKDLALPENVQQILDIAPASAGILGQGLVYLTELNGKRSLTAQFIRPGEDEDDLGVWAQYRLACPPGASSIAAFADPRNSGDGSSSLLVACSAGVILLPPSDIAGSRLGSGKLLCGAECVYELTQMYLTQDGDCLSLWGINNQQELAFMTTNLKEGAAVRAAPLLSAGSATSFAPLVSQAKDKQKSRLVLVVNDKHGNLTLLNQDLSTGVWRREPFYVESEGELKPIPSYTITVTAMEDASMPLCNGGAFISAASSLSATINGEVTMLTSVGRWCKLDCAGDLTLVIPTDKVSSQPIRVEKLRTAAGRQVTFNLTHIDPADKVIAKMKSLTSEDSLSQAKTKGGKSLWEGVDKPAPDDLKNAAKCFAAIADAHKTLPADGSTVKKAIVEKAGEVSSSANSLIQLFMDGYHWLKEKASQVVDWIVEKAGEVWQFVCKIGRKTMTFVLDCIEKVTEAASWIWQKLKVGFEKLVEFVGFLFSWDDIKETKNTIKGLLNAGLDFAADKVEGFNDKIDGFFGNIQASVAAISGVQANPGWTNKVSPASSKKDKEMDNFQNSTSSKWIGERMKNGGAQKPSGNAPAGTSDAELVKIWDDRIQPVIKSFTTLAEQLGEDISQLFRNESNMSQDQLLKKLGGNLLINFLEIMKKLLNVIISQVAKLVLVVKDFGNLRLSSGFLNSLWKMISGGSDLTLFDAVSLLIAIPSTLIIKIVTGAKPPTFPSIDKNLFESIVVAKGAMTSSAVQPASKQTMKDMTIIVLGCGCGAALIKVLVDNIKFMYKTVTQGLSVSVGGLSPSAIMEVFGMCIDAFSIYEDLIDPPTADRPGADLLQISTCLKCFRLAANAMYMLAGKLGFENPVTDQIMLCLDVLTAMANFGLYSAVCVKELEATSWDEHDEDLTLTNSTNNFLETLAAIGYFTAFTFKEKAPPVTLIGLGCMQVAAYGAIITKGVEFRLEYKKL